MANNITILVRADTAANWEGKDSLLRLREIGYDQTNRRFKVGDGVTTWKNLPYVKPDVINDLVSGGVDKALSAEQGKELKRLVDGCAGDIETINQNITNLEESITEIVEGGTVKVIDKLEEANSGTDALSARQGWVLKGLIDSKTSVAVVNNLVDGGTDKALSAEQGKTLKALIDAKPLGDSGTSVTVVNNLTSTSAENALSANQGRVLNGKIPSVIDNLTSTSSTSALSAKQGKELKTLVDSKTSITVINSLTSTSTTNALSANQGKVLNEKIPSVVNNLTSTSTTNALSAAQGKALNDKVKNYSTESWTFTLSTGSTVTKKVVLSS